MFWNKSRCCANFMKLKQSANSRNVPFVIGGTSNLWRFFLIENFLAKITMRRKIAFRKNRNLASVQNEENGHNSAESVLKEHTAKISNESLISKQRMNHSVEENKKENSSEKSSYKNSGIEIQIANQNSVSEQSNEPGTSVIDSSNNEIETSDLTEDKKGNEDTGQGTKHHRKNKEFDELNSVSVKGQEREITNTQEQPKKGRQKVKPNSSEKDSALPGHEVELKGNRRGTHEKVIESEDILNVKIPSTADTESCTSSVAQDDKTLGPLTNQTKKKQTSRKGIKRKVAEVEEKGHVLASHEVDLKTAKGDRRGMPKKLTESEILDVEIPSTADTESSVAQDDKTPEPLTDQTKRKQTSRKGLKRKVTEVHEKDCVLPSHEVDLKTVKGDRRGTHENMTESEDIDVEIASADTESCTASVAQDKKTEPLINQTKRKQTSRKGQKPKVIEVERSSLEKDNKGVFTSGGSANVVLKELSIVLKREQIFCSALEMSSHPEAKKVVGGTKGRGTKRSKQKYEESNKKTEKNPKRGDKKSAKKDEISEVTDTDFSNNSRSSKGTTWNYKISSWNVNGIRAWLEKGGLSYLDNEKPDIMCVQETKCSENKLPENIKEVEGYHTYWLAGDKDGYSGVGLMSKEEPLDVKFGIGLKEHDNEGRVITAEYEKFFLVAAYVPNAGRGLVRLDYRMKWDKDFCSYLKKLDENKPVILCGDLNVAHQEIDLANPKTNKKNAGFTKEEREGFSTLLEEGFIDTFRHFYPDTTGAYTFWTYMMNARAKNVGWRLDYFVVSKRFEENLCDSTIRKDILGSDHCPITLFLSL